MMLKQLQLLWTTKQIKLLPVHIHLLPFLLAISEPDRLTSARIANTSTYAVRVSQLSVAAATTGKHYAYLMITAAAKPPA